MSSSTAVQAQRKVKPVTLELPPLHPGQRAFVMDQHRFVYAACGSKTGKGQPLNAVVVTPTGPRRMGDIQVGDTVCTPTGGTTSVVGTFPQGKKPLFTIEFSDRSTTQCDDEHLWRVYDWHGRDQGLLTVKDLLTRPRLNRLFVQVANTVAFKTQEVPIDPYVLGVLIGDGCLRGSYTVGLTSADQQILENVISRLGPKYHLVHKDRCDYLIVTSDGRRGSNGLLGSLRQLGLYGTYSSNKFIPDLYKFNSENVRRELLRGIMDTDGSVDRRTGQPLLEQTSKQLADDVSFLVESLGGYVRTNIKAINGYRKNGEFVRGKAVYRQCLVVKSATDYFSLDRKKAICKDKKKPLRRYFRSIAPAGEAETKCIKVADHHGLYLTDHCIVTHNTFGMCTWLLLRAWNRYQSTNWWAAPNYRQAKIAFHLMGTWIPKGKYRVSRTDLVYELLRSNGEVHSRIEFRSADNPDGLRGEGVHSAVCDEACFWRYESFVSVMTTLTRTEGWLRVISTPKGKNWFWEEWLKGWQHDQDPEKAAKHPEHCSYQLPTHSNPHIKRSVLETFQREMTADVYRQEILAEFLDDAASVFKNVRDCATAVLLSAPVFGDSYVVGIDWAKKEDFTVFVVMDRATKKVVYTERHNEMDWNLNIDRAIKLAKRWNDATIWMDSTGLGDVPYDAVRAVYPYVFGYSISTNDRKVQLIQKLQLAFERKDLAIPNDPIMRRELEMYGVELSATGKPLYSAPEGYHDDLVIGLALAYWGADETPTGTYRFTGRRGI